MTSGWIIFSIFAAIWVWGWIASVRSVDFGHPGDGFWKRIGSIAILFVIWPYIAFCMAGQGDR